MTWMIIQSRLHLRFQLPSSFVPCTCNTDHGKIAYGGQDVFVIIIDCTHLVTSFTSFILRFPCCPAIIIHSRYAIHRIFNAIHGRIYMLIPIRADNQFRAFSLDPSRLQSLSEEIEFLKKGTPLTKQMCFYSIIYLHL
jgi:hypothetical protein